MPSSFALLCINSFFLFLNKFSTTRVWVISAVCILHIHRMYKNVGRGALQRHNFFNTKIYKKLICFNISINFKIPKKYGAHINLISEKLQCILKNLKKSCVDGIEQKIKFLQQKCMISFDAPGRSLGASRSQNTQKRIFQVFDKTNSRIIPLRLVDLT